jgi:hypothetical protein
MFLYYSTKINEEFDAKDELCGHPEHGEDRPPGVGAVS